MEFWEDPQAEEVIGKLQSDVAASQNEEEEKDHSFSKEKIAKRIENNLEFRFTIGDERARIHGKAHQPSLILSSVEVRVTE